VRSGMSVDQHARQVIRAIEFVEPGFFIVVYRDEIRKRRIR